MIFKCPNKIDCEGTDFPVTNYSSESPDEDLFVSVRYTPPTVEPPLDHEWDARGCLGVCTSLESQEDADLCAQAQAILCLENTDFPIYCNTPQFASAPCPDGSVFTYVVRAGLFCGGSQGTVDQAARGYAFQQAFASRICLNNIEPCGCVGGLYSQALNTSRSGTFSWAIILGALPPGLTFHAGTTNTATAVISGTPTTSGTYSFTVKVTDQLGNYMVKTYVLSILEITTTSLANYTNGTPYSAQLAVTGGSGHYAWKITSGQLPDGLSLSSTGLISGTPTGADSGVMPLIFNVVDTACELADQSFFPPKISLATTATITTKSKKGYPVFSGTSKTLYKKATWSGEVRQGATGVHGPQGVIQVAGAKFVFSGASEIDASGQFISVNRMDVFVPCNRPPFPPVAEGVHAVIALQAPGTYWQESRIHHALGWCVSFDQTSCGLCDFVNDASWPSMGNFASKNQYDKPVDVLLDPAGVTKTPTSYTYSGSVSNASFRTLYIIDPIVFSSAGSYSVVLSDEYTDADAEASKQVVTGTAPTAENLPDYLTTFGVNFLNWVFSRTTDVAFALNCTNLLDDHQYFVSYELWDSDGTKTTHSVQFTSTGTSHTVNGTIPAPAPGHTITIKNPVITFA